MTTMIPSELGLAQRPLIDARVQPVPAIQQVSAELPEFQLGQRFTARIEAALPDGSFRAVVAGRSMTLALPQSAKPGDTLNLVVLDRTNSTVLAGRVAATVAGPVPDMTLSPTGQLISNLLAHGEEATQSLAITTRATPLLSQPSASAAPLAPALQQAISESGLFYEAHQAQWIAGRLPLESLLREPQGKQALETTPATDPVSQASQASQVMIAQRAETADTARASETSAKLVGVTTLPADLQPLVQRQLDTAATQQIVWQGEVWPGQTLHWKIEEKREEERQENAPAGVDAPAAWHTHMRLDLPRLGDVGATLKLGPAGLTIELSAAASASANTLRRGQAELAAALTAAGLPPTLIKVGQYEPT